MLLKEYQLRLTPVLILILDFLQDSTCIRISEVKVPKYLEVGLSGDLDCSWAEEGDHMYSIKWYQAANEFYRYTPTAREPIQIFDWPTLDVDREKSWGGSVRISNVTLEAAGPFHCEVSADGPTFHTASEQATLNVVDLPDGNPTIEGIRPQYFTGDWVDIKCISRGSNPAPTLSFMVNDSPAIPGWIDPQTKIVDDRDGSITSSLRMRFSLTPRLLQGVGYAMVKCKVTIPDIYENSVNQLISTRAPYHASVLDGGTASDKRPGTFMTLGMVAGTLIYSSLYRPVS